MNRILAYLHQRECSHCAKFRDIQRQLDLAKLQSETIEMIIGEEVGSFWIPDAERVLKPKPDDDDHDVGIRFMLGEICEPETAPLDADLYAYAATELLRVGNALLAAACKLQAEGGVS